MPKIKNISIDNIIIFNKILVPEDSINITQEQLEEISSLIENNKLRVEISPIKRTEIKINSLDDEKTNQYLDLKEKIIPALFALQFNQNLVDTQLDDLKWFFKNVGQTSELNNEIKSLIDDVQSDEELIEVLLNHLYPELIKNYFLNK